MMRQKYPVIYSLIIAACLLGHSRADEPMRVVFLGDSLTAGYALDADQAYPALIQKKIDERQWPFRVVNSGISGDTTAGGLRRLDWLMRQPFSVLVVALGANDGLRGFNPNVTKSNLSQIIDKSRSRYPSATILLAGMKLPMNMGEVYANNFAAVFSSLAAEYDIPFLPFLLEGVAGDAELNLPDGIHPTPEGQKILAANVWKHLEPILLEQLRSVSASVP